MSEGLILTPGRQGPPPAISPPPPTRLGPDAPAALRFRPGRISDNELILFDEQARESWIIYPPRSAYSFVKRPSASSTVVEHHPWAPLSEIRFHVVTAATGCAEHGIECDAFSAIKAASELGWDAFR